MIYKQKQFPIGTVHQEWTTSALVIQDVKQFVNILKTHVGWIVVPIGRQVQPDTFCPEVVFMLYKEATPSDIVVLELPRPEFYIASMQVSQETKEQFKVNMKDLGHGFQMIEGVEEIGTPA